MALVAVNLKPNIGSVVKVDREALLEESVIARIHELLEQRGVLVFPRIGLSDAEQLALTDKLGTRADFVKNAPGAGDVYKITLDPRHNPQPEYVQGTFFWHMDGLNADIPPPKATLLSARRTAPKGGQTEFANTYAAYESLSDEDRIDIAGLKAFHSLLSSMKQVVELPTSDELARWSRSPNKEHPLVWTHGSGRKSLVVGTTADHVIGMQRPDGRALLSRLLEWTVQPDFHYRHQWQEGDLVIWDNCGTLHRVIPYERNSGRTMHRTAIAGREQIQ